MVDKLEQVIRLIRSKGVGIYFISQSPSDIPDAILGQLGNRIQHALRAYTPKDQKAVRVAAQSFRTNPKFSTEEAIMELGTGEALVSVLDENGAPSVVQRANILFPLSQIGAVTEGQRLDVQNAAPDGIKEYASFYDRESAYEVLMAQKQREDADAVEMQRQKEEVKRQKEAERQRKQDEKEAEQLRKQQEKAAEQLRKQKEREAKEKSKSSNVWKRTIFGTLIGAVLGSVGRHVGNEVGKTITGGSSRSTSSRKTTSARKTTKSSSAGSILGSAAKTAATTATRRVTNEILKNIFK
jgi:hypothetical protein